jgi:DNA primase
LPRIAQSVVDEVKQLNIVDVISPYAELKKSGANYVALCPLPSHREKTPSFTVNEQKGIFYCFGCHIGGDGIKFIQEYKGYDFSEAVVFLCERFGIEAKYENAAQRHSDISSALKGIYKDVEEYCAESLYSKEGALALAYLEKRGFAGEIISRFKLGYMPKFPEITRFKDKYRDDVLYASGIFSKGTGSMFRERLIIPIRSANGACIALSGRALVSVEKGKYINSPETPIFIKHKTLYNLDKAMSHIQKSKSCWLVEGYFDAIRMAAAGIENTVAIMGTAISKENIAQISRHVEEYNLLLDGDRAGINAMEKSYAGALKADIYPNIVLLPEGEDPDSFIAKNGADALKDLEKKDLIEYMIRRKFDGAADANTKFYRLDDVRKMLEQIIDPYRREYYINLTSKIFEVNIRTLTADIGTEVPKIKEHKSKKSAVKNITERRFLSLLLELPEESADKIIQEITPEYLEDETARKLYKKIIELAGEDDVIARLGADTDVGEAAALLILEEKRSSDIFAEIYDCKNRIILTHLENRQKELIINQTIAADSERAGVLREFAANTEKMKELKAKLAKKATVGKV